MLRANLGGLRGFDQRSTSGGCLPMSKRIFVSYSSPDAEKATLIREALEDHDISCRIAPRDLSAGTQWGAGIVQAIQACEAVVVVFSDAANRSPQVAREMELAVSNRKPLIPIRVADAMPTDDMQYFLGVSHWFNAYAMPIEAYLPDVVTAVKNVLARENSLSCAALVSIASSRTGCSSITTSRSSCCPRLRKRPVRVCIGEPIRRTVTEYGPPTSRPSTR